MCDERRSLADRGEGRRLDRPAQRRRKTDGPDNPERVLLEAPARVADRANDAVVDVGPAAERIDEVRRRLGRLPSPGQGIHREVAT